MNWGPNEPNDNGGTEMCVGMGSNYGTCITKLVTYKVWYFNM